MEIEAIARITHETNRAYCATLGDFSHLTWDAAPQWQKESAVAGVKARLKGQLTPQQQHEAWLEHKQADGWTYGAVKDPEAKKHPCMLPYDELPIAERLKDALFGAIVDVCKPANNVPMKES